MSIEISGLRKSFGASVAVAGIDLSVPQGEMLVLLGPSGCGKTTTMRCIAGLETPDSGTITIAGKPVYDGARGFDMPINRRNVGMVFQSYAIWPHMTVRENVAFPLEMQGLGRAEMTERTDRILELVGLADYAGRGASQLSGGQMQRVALARSLVMQPSVLLFDEPLSNLDARLRDRLRVQLRELQTLLGITSVYVTHDQAEALALADQIAVMEAGTILQIEPPVALYQRPRTAAVADFLGYVNVFDAALAERAGDLATVTLAGTEGRLRSSLPPPPSGEICGCIRPTEIGVRLRENGAVDPARLPENTLAGEIVLASFLGSHMQYRVRVAGGAVWEVLSPRIADDIRVGTAVLVEIPAGQLLLLPRS